MKVEDKHDFTAKLRQASLLPRVLNYVLWQREVRKAETKGENIPPIPKDIVPISVNLDLTTTCNYRCPHCIDSKILNSRDRYNHEGLLLSLENMIEQGLRSVILIGGGEPTLYPKFNEIIHFLKKHGIQVAIVSNGSLNNKIYEISDILSKNDWIRFSLDSGTEETFQKIHRPKKPVGLEDICSWIPRIHERNPKLQVGFSFVIIWQGTGMNDIVNINEIVQATRLAREYGFNYISFKPILTRHPSGTETIDPCVITDFNETVNKIRNSIGEARHLETTDFKVVESINLRVLMDGSWREFTKQPRVCHITAFRQVLSPLGLYNCPAYRGAGNSRIGDCAILNEPETAQEQVANMIHRFNACDRCKSITCLYNRVNRWIEGMIESDIDLNQIESLPDFNDYYL